MKSFLFLIIFLFTAGIGYSQQGNCACSSAGDYDNMLQSGLIGVEYFNPVKGYVGEQYFNNWSRGEVILQSSDVIREVPIRYDKYLDALLWMRRSDYKTGILNKGDMLGFRIFEDRKKSDQPATFMKTKLILTGGDSTFVFLQVMVSGEIGLSVFRNVNVISTTAYKLNDNTKYYLTKAGKLYPITLRRKSLLSAPVIQKSDMKSVLLTHWVMIRNNEAELIRSLNLYNQKHRQ